MRHGCGGNSKRGVLMTEATRPTIPTIIDSVKRYTDFAMTRCIYFCIEAIEPVEASFTDLDLPCFKVFYWLVTTVR